MSMTCLPRHPEVDAHGQDGGGHEQGPGGQPVVQPVREVVNPSLGRIPLRDPGGKRQTHRKHGVIHV